MKWLWTTGCRGITVGLVIIATTVFYWYFFFSDTVKCWVNFAHLVQCPNLSCHNLVIALFSSLWTSWFFYLLICSCIAIYPNLWQYIHFTSSWPVWCLFSLVVCRVSTFVLPYVFMWSFSLNQVCQPGVSEGIRLFSESRSKNREPNLQNSSCRDSTILL